MRRNEFLLFVLLLFCYTYFIQPAQANALSRYNLVRAVVDHGTIVIDPYADNTIDKTEREGHYYSDKAPGTSLFALPAYLVERGLERIFASGHPLEETHRVFLLTALIIALPAALLGLLLYRTLELLTPGSGANPFLVLAYGLATIAFPFSTMLFGHQPAAFFIFASFYCLLLIRTNQMISPHVGLALLAGAFAGAAVITEYPVALIAGVLVIYAILVGRRKNVLLSFIGGAAPFVVFLGAYHTAAYGAPWKTPSCCLVESQFAGATEGLNGVSLPDPIVMLQLLFAGRGILATSPFLIFVPVGVVLLWRGKRFRVEAAIFAAAIMLILLYNAGYYLPFGGWSPGPRFLLPALPFAIATLAPVGARLARPSTAPRWLYGLFWLTIAVSFIPIWLAVSTATLAPDTRQFPLLEVWLPGLLDGFIVHNLGRLLLGLDGVLSLLPPVIAVASTVIVLLFGHRLDRSPQSSPDRRDPPRAPNVGSKPITGRDVLEHERPQVEALAAKPLANVPRVTKPTRADFPWILPIGGLLWCLLLLPLLVFSQVDAIVAAPAPIEVQRFEVEKPVLNAGDQQVARILLRNGPAPQYDIAAWLEVLNSSGARVFEDWRYPMTLRPGEERALTMTWTVPEQRAPNRRVARFHVLDPSWSHSVGESEQPVSFEVRMR